MAPEVALHQPYNERVDIYSFGILLWQIATGLCPFHGYNQAVFQKRVVEEGDRPPLEFLSVDTVHIRLSPELKEILRQSWSSNWIERPSARQLSESVTALLTITLETETRLWGRGQGGQNSACCCVT